MVFADLNRFSIICIHLHIELMEAFPENLFGGVCAFLCHVHLVNEDPVGRDKEGDEERTKDQPNNSHDRNTPNDTYHPQDGVYGYPPSHQLCPDVGSREPEDERVENENGNQCPGCITGCQLENDKEGHHDKGADDGDKLGYSC